MTGMQKADDLSKHGTTWLLTNSFTAETFRLYGVHPTMPDVAAVQQAVDLAVVKKVPQALVIPRWEAKSWWEMANRHARHVVHMDSILEVTGMVHPNAHGFPRWDFAMFIFS